MLSHDPFRQELRAQIRRGLKRGATELVVNSTELRRAVSACPRPSELQLCRDVMREEMRAGDSIIAAQEDLVIRYILPSSI